MLTLVCADGRFVDAIRAGRISKVETIKNCCILAAVGQQMASRKGVAATMFSALAKANINIRCGCSMSECPLTCSVWNCCNKAAKVINGHFDHFGSFLEPAQGPLTTEHNKVWKIAAGMLCRADTFNRSLLACLHSTVHLT